MLQTRIAQHNFNNTLITDYMYIAPEGVIGELTVSFCADSASDAVGTIQSYKHAQVLGSNDRTHECASSVS